MTLFTPCNAVYQFSWATDTFEL